MTVHYDTYYNYVQFKNVYHETMHLSSPLTGNVLRQFMSHLLDHL